MLIQQKLEHRVSVGLRLLDIGDMRGIKDRDLRARDVVADEFIGSRVVAGSWLPAITSVGALIFASSGR